MIMNTSHLNALELRLSHEKSRLASEKSENGRALRAVWVSKIENEIKHELAFLGKACEVLPNMSDVESLGFQHGMGTRAWAVRMPDGSEKIAVGTSKNARVWTAHDRVQPLIE